MNFPELSFVKFAAAAAVTEPTTVGESIERSCMAYGMLGALAAAKKEAGVLTEDDQKLIDKVARVCRNTYKFGRLLKNATAMLNGNDALQRTIAELAYGAMSSKVAYSRLVQIGMFDRAFGSLDETRLNAVAEKMAALSNTEKLLKIADEVGPDGGIDDDGDDDEEMTRAMQERMARRNTSHENQEEDEGEEEAPGAEAGAGGEMDLENIPPDVLAALLQQLNSSNYDSLQEGMGMAEGGESDTSEVARQLAQLGMTEEQPDSIAPILAALAMSGQHA
jgi:hypothetical protein